MTKVFLDAGHGGHDSGAVGNGMLEKDIALAVTLKIGNILKQHNLDVGYSRTGDKFVELNERARQANSFNADVFVSVHCNAFSKANAKGVETYHYPNSTNGNKLANNIHNYILKDKLYTVDRGIKSANFSVLRNTKMPGALVELGFITNIEDSRILRSKHDELAESVARGILKHLGIKYQEDNLKPSKDKIEGQNLVKIKKDGKIIEVEGFLRNGSNFVKVREVFEKLGYKISWDNENKIVVVD